MEEVWADLTGARRGHGRVAWPICCPGSSGRESEAPWGNSHHPSPPAHSVCKEALCSRGTSLSRDITGRKSKTRATELGTGLWAVCTGEQQAACHPTGSRLDFTGTGDTERFLSQRETRTSLHLGEMTGIWQVEASVGSCLPSKVWGKDKGCIKALWDQRGRRQSTGSGLWVSVWEIREDKECHHWQHGDLGTWTPVWMGLHSLRIRTQEETSRPPPRDPEQCPLDNIYAF